jgi:hypothetical protein
MRRIQRNYLFGERLGARQNGGERIGNRHQGHGRKSSFAIQRAGSKAGF